MKYRFCNRIVLIVLLMLCSFSCSSDLDFEQANDLNAQPVVVANLAYVLANAPDLVENGIDLPPLFYSAKVGFFDTSFVNQNLIKAELYIRMKNTINRSFTVNVDLRESNGALVRNIRIDVPASVNGSEVLVDPTTVFAGPDIDQLRRTTQMSFSVKMNTGTPLTENSPGRIELSSSITTYFDVR